MLSNETGHIADSKKSISPKVIIKKKSTSTFASMLTECNMYRLICDTFNNLLIMFMYMHNNRSADL